MGSVKYKPRRAKCHKCGNGMIQRSNAQKYCASCGRAERLRNTYESHVRNGYYKNPGIGRGWKPRHATCHECGNRMLQKSGGQRYCVSCRKIVQNRNHYNSKLRKGLIKNPGVGSQRSREDNSNWRGGSRGWQIRAFRGTECERCGSEEEMHLHHRDRDVSNWKADNLETLCAPCHREEHPPVWLGA